MTSWDLGGEGNSFPFDNMGDWIRGVLFDLVERQGTDMETNQPAVWDNGDPKMITVLSFATELRDPNNPGDTGARTVVLSGSKKPESLSRMAAVVSAVKQATSATTLEFGCTITLQYVGDGQATRRGFTAPKQYQAWYESPTFETKAVAQAALQATVAQPPQQAQAGPPPNVQPPDQQWPPNGVQQAPGPNPAGAHQQLPTGPPPNVQQGPPPQGAGGPGSGWPPPNQGPPPGFAQPALDRGSPLAASDPKTATVTRVQVAGLQAINIDPASVYGPDWQSRVVD